LTDTDKLRTMIKESGLKYNYIANKLSLSRHGLKKKIDNDSEFKSSEIIALSEILHIRSPEERESIFFRPEVDNKSTHVR
jgi:hypothetical protein